MVSASMTEDIYHKVKQAKQQDAVVLQVVGDRDPVRVLPLPTTEVSGAKRSVYVSTLLQQSGVMDKFRNLEAALYRPADHSLDGIRMNVIISEEGLVRPESDYALRPGDRLVVREAQAMDLASITDMLMGG